VPCERWCDLTRTFLKDQASYVQPPPTRSAFYESESVAPLFRTKAGIFIRTSIQALQDGSSRLTEAEDFSKRRSLPQENTPSSPRPKPLIVQVQRASPAPMLNVGVTQRRKALKAAASRETPLTDFCRSLFRKMSIRIATSRSEAKSQNDARRPMLARRLLTFERLRYGGSNKHDRNCMVHTMQRKARAPQTFHVRASKH